MTGQLHDTLAAIDAALTATASTSELVTTINTLRERIAAHSPFTADPDSGAPR